METLRSTFLPLSVLAGTKLFLSFDPAKGLYYIHTRFQTLKRSRTLSKLTDVWDDYSLGFFDA